MRILILGESGSSGAGLPDPESAWVRIVEREVHRCTGEPPEMVHVRLYTWSSGWEDHLERALERGPFDVVVLSPTKFAFTVYSADNRIRRLLGRRAGDWFKGQADAFDSKTRKPGDNGIRRNVNRSAHRAVRRIVGQAPISTVEAITATYIQAMARLARLEDTQVVVFGNTDASSVLARRHPEIVARTARFRSALKAEAERRRFDWIERESLWDPKEGDRERMFSDGLHKTAELHSRLARAVLELVMPRSASGGAP